MDPLSTFELFSRLVFALALGALLGVERNLVHKTAGMRTYGLVSLGAALFTLISVEAGKMYLGFADFDPLRMASQVIVGIGFLGGGLIIFRDGGVENLTTAAGLWVAAGVGIATGMGLYALAIFAIILTLLTFTLLWYFEQKIKKVAEKMEYGEKVKQKLRQS
ncbi:MgtC/SapB family protein [bacterium]|nr:MgtC/SapB family protein [bacterium]